MSAVGVTHAPSTTSTTTTASSNGPAPKIEPGREGSISSPSSTSGPEPESFATEHVTIQKRKGGRKPIYATSEERKQRNRQAQAAFRERRTEYIKQLEATIKHRDETLHALQQSHRAAADECLMLRYKNSLLERILLEKGIDVQAELNAQASSPHPGPPTPGPSTTHAIKRGPMPHPVLHPPHPVRRPETNQGSVGDAGHHPTHRSQRSSPTSIASGSVTTTTAAAAHGVMTPAGSDLSAPPLPQHQQRPAGHGPTPHGLPAGHHHLRHLSQRAPSSQMLPEYAHPMHANGTSAHPHASAGPIMLGMTTTNGPMDPAVTDAAMVSSHYYGAAAPFRDHYHQLGKLSQQEYDAHADDDDPIELSAGPGPHPPFFEGPVDEHRSLPAHALAGLEHLPQAPLSGGGGMGSSASVFTTNGGGGSGSFGPAGTGMRTDEDPFGSWNGMGYPNPFAYPPTAMR
ncbi:MAG: hypothetical protein M1823_000613 [Watsoniomyces obsoletus]|nr:MAG: hypothetical protein M1823_000613 [Watsoniomyces obsoletus]